MRLVGGTMNEGRRQRPLRRMAVTSLHQSWFAQSMFLLFLLLFMAAHAWGSVYECRDQEGHRIITDSPSQLEECKTISSTPSSSKKSGFGGNQSYGEASPVVTQSPAGAGVPIQYPPVLITGPNGEVISEPDPAAGQAAQPATAPQAQPGVGVNQLHPFLPPVSAPQAGSEQKP